MTHKASHGKQMAQHLHPYYPIPTIHNFPIEQLHQTNLNPEEWKEYMKVEIEKAENKTTFQKHKVIGFVPRALFEVKPQSYCPRILTVGPLYQNLEPSSMDRCKALCVKKFMERHKISDLERLMNELILQDPKELRDIYFSLSPSHNFESLGLLVTVDTVFIHEFFLFLSEDCPDSQEKKSGYLYTFINNEITISQIWRDLLLIGNQIPMSFLKKVINIPQELPDFTENDLVKLLDYFVSVNDPFRMSRFKEWEHNKTEKKQGDHNLLECEHLLDCLYVSCTQKESHEHSMEPQKFKNPSRCMQLLNLLWRCKESMKQPDFCPTTLEPSKYCNWFKQVLKYRKEQRKTASTPFNRLPSASQLYNAGIRFKACEGSILVVKYDQKKRQLHLPRLVVYHCTEDVLRNLLAHEQTSKKVFYWSMYAILMNSLIEIHEDIAILTRAKVLDNNLESDDKLVQMWRDMCTNIEESFDWRCILRDLAEHCATTHWHYLYAEFREKYFSRPWLWMKVLAAILLLVFSLLQTLFSILGYYQNLTPAQK